MAKVTVPHGTVRWVDLGTTDLASAIEFYRAVFGWEPEELDDGHEHDWVLQRLDGKDVVGMGGLQPAEPLGWTTFIHCDDAANLAKRVIAAGGSVITEPVVAFEYGTTGVYADPSGAHFAIWEPDEDRNVSEFWGAVNGPRWCELRTPDPESVASFYESLFGWKREPSEGSYVRWSLDGEPVAGAVAAEPPGGKSSAWTAYFRVADCDDAIRVATENGGSIIESAIDSSVGRVALVADRQGQAFGVIAEG